MKTILFTYYDATLKRTVCDAYVTLEKRVDEIIAWKRKIYERDIKEGYCTSLTIQVIDKIDVSVMN